MNEPLGGGGVIRGFMVVFNFKVQVTETLIIIINWSIGLLAFAMESQDIAAVFREENSTLVSQYNCNF